MKRGVREIIRKLCELILFFVLDFGDEGVFQMGQKRCGSYSASFAEQAEGNAAFASQMKAPSSVKRGYELSYALCLTFTVCLVV